MVALYTVVALLVATKNYRVHRALPVRSKWYCCECDERRKANIEKQLVRDNVADRMQTEMVAQSNRASRCAAWSFDCRIRKWSANWIRTLKVVLSKITRLPSIGVRRKQLDVEPPLQINRPRTLWLKVTNNFGQIWWAAIDELDQITHLEKIGVNVRPSDWEHNDWNHKWTIDGQEESIVFFS